MYRQIKKLREFLMKNFVEENLGIEHMARKTIQIKHTSEISKKIFEPGVDSIITCGTVLMFTFKSHQITHFKDKLIQCIKIGLF
jgi:hypothetical protein